MAIFNSLGSNYSGSFVWKSLFGSTNKASRDAVRQQLADHYGGQAVLTYKGRQALELALKNSGLAAGSSIGINGFTCYVVYQAVQNAGYTPVFIDVAPKTMHFDVTELQQAHTKHNDLAAVIVQNTLGVPCNMQDISAYCKKHKLILVEDLAHSVGLTYQDDREAGMVGDLVMLSFSQDKQLDVIAGGAYIDRRSGGNGEHTDQNDLPAITAKQRAINRTYPFWTAIIRGTYPMGLGRYIHFALKRFKLLATPMSDNLTGVYRMTAQAASLLASRWAARANEIAHRQKIAAIYTQHLPPQLQFKDQGLGRPVYLRFPLWVNDRKSFVQAMQRCGIYIGDTWYDAPIAPSRYLDKTTYQTGQCPNADQLAEHIVNLPTHQHVTEEQAQSICKEVQAWHTSP